eukprot:6626662-Prorocentrum_lima.AAC.1
MVGVGVAPATPVPPSPELAAALIPNLARASSSVSNGKHPTGVFLSFHGGSEGGGRGGSSP